MQEVRHNFGDHRRCLMLDIPECEVKPLLPGVIETGLAALREQGGKVAVVALEPDGGLRVWGTTTTTKQTNSLRFKAYRHYKVTGYPAHGVVYLVQDDPTLTLL